MQTKMNKEVLIQIIMQNMAKHKEIYEKAWTGYQEVVIKTLKQNLKNIKEGVKESVHVFEQVPVDQTPQYERALDMLKYHNDDYVVLNAEDYSRYVQDDWEWKQQWLMSTSKYR